MGELLDRIGSYELAEWIAEFRLRNEDQERAYEDVKNEPQQVS